MALAIGMLRRVGRAEWGTLMRGLSEMNGLGFWWRFLKDFLANVVNEVRGIEFYFARDCKCGRIQLENEQKV